MVEIPSHLHGWRFILLSPKSKIPTKEMKGWAEDREKRTYFHDSYELLEHISNGDNYGVLTDTDRFVVGCDTKEVEAAIEKRLPPTFTVKSPRHQTKHFYFYGKISKPIHCKPTQQGDPCADIKFGNAYVVGPGSVFEGYGEYKIIDDRPIATITEEQLLAAIDEFVLPQNFESETEVKEKDEFEDIPELNFPIEKIIPNIDAFSRRGDELYGPHPLHGSTTGSNFHVNLKDNTFYCFRAGHQSGGGSLLLLAVMEGILKCEEAKKGALRGDKFIKTVEIAKKRGLIPKDFQFITPGMKHVEFDEKGRPHIDMQGILDDLRGRYIFKTPTDTEELNAYRDGIYVPIEPEVKGLLESWLRVFCTTHLANEVVNHLIRGSYVERKEFNNFTRYLPVKNGLLDLVKLKVKPFDPNQIFTYKLNVEYDPTKKCPKWEKFLLEILKPEDIPTMQEWLGYCIFPKMPFHKMMWFFGEGRNGKGRVIITIERLLGMENCQHLELSELNPTRRFSVAQLYGKLVNISSEPNVNRELQTPLLKKIVGEDTISGEIKHKQKRLTFVNVAKPIVVGNRFPKVTDTTLAFWDRILLISFPYVFIGKKQIPNIEKQWLDDPDEPSGILNWMIEGLHRLLERGYFERTKTQQQIITEFKRVSDTIGAWLEERVEYDIDGFVSRDESFNDYKDYCDGIPATPETVRSFYARLRRTPRIAETMIKIKGSPVRGWRGITLKPTPEEEEAAKQQKLNHLPSSNSIIPSSSFLEKDENKDNIINRKVAEVTKVAGSSKYSGKNESKSVENKYMTHVTSATSATATIQKTAQIFDTFATKIEFERICGNCEFFHTPNCVKPNPILIQRTATYAETCKQFMEKRSHNP